LGLKLSLATFSGGFRVSENLRVILALFFASTRVMAALIERSCDGTSILRLLAVTTPMAEPSRHPFPDAMQFQWPVRNYRLCAEEYYAVVTAADAATSVWDRVTNQVTKITVRAGKSTSADVRAIRAAPIEI
jgi:hypothetical protein